MLKLSPRARHEAHRVATPLELLFDLAFVVAIASAAEGLHHAVGDNHALDGVVAFAMAFFAVWWAWMNFTWFASAYGDDGVRFRLLGMVIMAGALLVAADVPSLFAKAPFTLGIVGYVVMRLAMVPLWLAAARGHAERRRTCLVYAGGITLTQLYWLALLTLGSASPLFLALFVVGAVAELAVPVLAERNGATPWHPHHIAERYGLLNLIVLGEGLLAVVLALRGDAHLSLESPALHVAAAATLAVFALWFLYFTDEPHLSADDSSRSFTWGYGHALIFAAGAALGAGFAVAGEIAAHHAHVPPKVGDLAVAIPLALYLLGLWFVRDRFVLSPGRAAILPAGAVLILALAALLPSAMSAIVAALVAITIARLAGRRARAPTH